MFCVIQQFSSDIADNASTVCLAHLFTYQDFDEGTLGLAYVAPSKPNALGGLCPRRKDTQQRDKAALFLKLKVCETIRKPVYRPTLLCWSHFVAYYPSQSSKKPSYLNTGLTSTKNYGKTILTKVSCISNKIFGQLSFCVTS